jgi:hypothetical protein
MAEDWIVRQRTSWEQRLDRLGDYLTERTFRRTRTREHTMTDALGAELLRTSGPE